APWRSVCAISSFALYLLPLPQRVKRMKSVLRHKAVGTEPLPIAILACMSQQSDTIDCLQQEPLIFHLCLSYGSMTTIPGQSQRQEGHMRQRTATVCALAMALLWLTGCQTLGDVMREKAEGGGTVQVYPVDTDQAWKIALTVFRWEGSDAIEEHRDQSYM